MQKEDPAAELKIIERLQTLNSKAAKKTQATLESRLAAMVANHSELTEVLIEAAKSPTAADSAKISGVREQRGKLAKAIDDVLERETFKPIGRIQDDTEIADTPAALEKAAKEIESRHDVRAMLNSLIDVSMTAATIGTKLAAL